VGGGLGGGGGGGGGVWGVGWGGGLGVVGGGWLWLGVKGSAQLSYPKWRDTLSKGGLFL